MRTFTFFLLLSASAVPALASADEDNQLHDRQSARTEQSEQRQQRTEQRQQRAERAQPRDDGQRAAQVEAMREQRQQMQVQRMEARQQMPAQRQSRFEQRAGDRQSGQAVVNERQRHQRQIEGRRARAAEGGESVQSGGLVQRQRHIRTIPDTTPEVLQTSPQQPAATQSTRHNRGDYSRWSGGWRNDSRYDWQRHRHKNRSKFRIGFYFDPFGYSYRRFSIGSSIWPSYYQSRYYINDPWQYRLPPAYGPYRWVRYHNDALLIDTWTGQVVDVLYGFFW